MATSKNFKFSSNKYLIYSKQIYSMQLQLVIKIDLCSAITVSIQNISAITVSIQNRSVQCNYS